MYIFAIDNVTSENFNLLYIILCMVTFIKKYVEFYEKDICTCTTSISRPALKWCQLHTGYLLCQHEYQKAFVQDDSI